MKAFYEGFGRGLRVALITIAIAAFGGCNRGGSDTQSPDPSQFFRALLGSYRAQVALNPPSIYFEPVTSSGLNPQGLAGTDLVVAAYPFQIQGALYLTGSTASIAVTVTNMGISVTALTNMDARIRWITDPGITIIGDTLTSTVPGGIVPGGYFSMGTAMPGNGVTGRTWVFTNVTSDFRFGFDVYGDPDLPPAVALFVDTSGSMTSLPCAMPDGEDACGIRVNQSPLPNPGTPSSYFIGLGYDPSHDYGYSTSNPTCFDPNITVGGEGCFYGGITTTTAHVYMNGYFSNPPTMCSALVSKGPGGNLPSYWFDCGTIDSFCDARGTNLGWTAAQKAACKDQFIRFGYFYDSTLSNPNGQKEAFYSGNLLEFFPPKFVVTKKVLDDIIIYNSSVLYPQHKSVRIGLFSFNSASTGAETDVKILPPCSQLGSNPTPGNYENTLYNLQSIHSTPLAGALIQVGSYFANTNTNASWYNTLGCNGNSYCSGLIGPSLGTACSLADSWCGCYFANNANEKNSIIVMTDGHENSGPSGMTTWPISTYSADSDTLCLNAPGGVCHVDEVAAFLYNNNIRPPNNTPYNVRISTYTIGFAGIAANGAALIPLELQRAAYLGGGLFFSAGTYTDLFNTYASILNNISW